MRNARLSYYKAFRVTVKSSLPRGTTLLVGSVLAEMTLEFRRTTFRPMTHSDAPKVWS